MKNQKEIEEARNKMLELYDSAPYSGVLNEGLQQNTPLLINLINAASNQDHIPLGPNSNMLVAGCGAGEEVFMLGRSFPSAHIVGVDFSENSILKANEERKKNGLSNVTFQVADLMTSDWCKNYNDFNFILCRGVADYVVDPSILMHTLAGCLNDKGVICMMMNSPHHPAGRIRDAFLKLGISPEDYIDSTEQRQLLQFIDGLIGSDAKLQWIGTAPLAYLKVDIFPPIAHHDSIEKWCERAAKSGLTFAGSMDTPLDILKIADGQLPWYYNFSKASISLWMANLSQRPGMQLIFRKRKFIEPDFSNLEMLWKWKPRIDKSIGNLPELQGDPNQLRSLSLKFPGMPDCVINCTAYDLEVLRRSNGVVSLSEIRSVIPVDGNVNSLLACLYRAYHYGLIS